MDSFPGIHQDIPGFFYKLMPFPAAFLRERHVRDKDISIWQENGIGLILSCYLLHYL